MGLESDCQAWWQVRLRRVMLPDQGNLFNMWHYNNWIAVVTKLKIQHTTHPSGKSKLKMDHRGKM